MAYLPPSEKWRLFENVQPSNAKWFVCCTLSIQYIIYSMVGWSIASISNLGDIFTSVLRASVNMVPRVEYISNGPPNIRYILHITSLVNSYCH